MARSDTRYSIYPSPKAIEIIGNSSPALNQAVECWAADLARAMADNSHEFSETEITNAELEVIHQLHDWGLIADALKGMRFDPEFAKPGYLLASAVEEGHRLLLIGERWFYDPDLPNELNSEKRFSEALQRLTKQLHDLDYVHAWAMIMAVQWYWDHHEEGIDLAKDPWWTLKFRREWLQKQEAKSIVNKRGKDKEEPKTRKKAVQALK